MQERPPLIQNPWKCWLAGFAFRTAVGLCFARPSGMQGEPEGAMEALERSLAQWRLWGPLAALIVRIDGLPLSPPDALFRRALWHAPLSPAVSRHAR